MITSLILENVYFEKKQLDNKEVDKIVLNNVYPSLLEDIFGEGELDVNGWQGDYWWSNEDYRVFGTMYYGTAEIKRNE